MTRRRLFLTISGSIATATLAFLLLHYWSFQSRSHNQVTSLARVMPKDVTLRDSSGRLLTSFFEGLPVDRRYPQFLKHLAERHTPCGAEKPTQISRIVQSLGLSFNTVVHAQGCQICGFSVEYVYMCAEQCGNYPYDGPLLLDANNGIVSSGPQCQGGDNCGNPSYGTQNCGGC